MNSAQETDFTTLSWVKAELDVTLGEAGQALARFVAHPAESNDLRACANSLHVVHGTLKMVEMYGAALVVEEMERVVNGMLNGGIVPREDVYSVLMRGFLQLPDYLERVQGGYGDIPIVLLPLLNDLRAARGEKLLSEAVLFAPNIDAALPEPNAQSLSAEDLRKAATGWRNEYQMALLRWIRDANPEVTLARMQQVFGQLYASCAEANARRLWWVAGAVVDDLRCGTIASSVAIRLLFGKIDREIKRLVTEGESAFASAPPRELVKNLLYYLAHANGHGHLGTDVVNFYRLGQLLPSEDELAHARGSISGYNRALFDAVAGGIREYLLRVKDALNIYLHSPQRNVADLAVQGETLASIADTFGMLGLGRPRAIVLEQRAALARIVNGEVAADENSLLDIAGSLLVVEASLEDHIDRLGAKPQAVEETQAHSLPRIEIVRLFHVLMQEALVNVGKIKQGVLAYIESSFERTVLEPVPGLLAEVAGALDMLSLRDLAKPVGTLIGFVRDELLERHRTPEQRQTGALVDAIAALEYYIEAVRDQHGDRERSLALLTQSVAVFELAPAARPAEAVAVAENESAAATETPAATAAVSEIAAVTAQTPETTSAATVAATIAAPEIAEATPVEAAPAEATPVAAATAPAAAPSPAVPVIDDELRQVFLDEMDDEIASLRKNFPVWRANPEERVEHLRTVRRSFHTLKGSGRLVGAIALGDFAWTVENMLNRVLDHSILPSPALLQIVGEAIDVLPRFREDLRKGEPSSFAQAPFAARVEHILAGDVVSGDEVPVAEHAAVAPAAVDAVVEPVHEAEPIAASAPQPEEVHDAQIRIEETPPEVTPTPVEPLPPLDFAPVEAAVPEIVAAIPAAPTAQAEIADLPTPHDTGTTAPVEVVVPEIVTATPAAPTAQAETADLPTPHDTGTTAPVETAAASSGERVAPVAPAVEAHSDPLLLDVLRSEARAHLAIVDASIQRGHMPPQHVDENLLRAAHALDSAFAVTGAASISRVLVPFESWLARLHDAGRPFDASGIEVLGEVSAFTKTTLAAFGTPGMPLADRPALVARIVALRDGVEVGGVVDASAEAVSSAPRESVEKIHVADIGHEETVAEAATDIVRPVQTGSHESPGHETIEPPPRVDESAAPREIGSAPERAPHVDVPAHEEARAIARAAPAAEKPKPVADVPVAVDVDEDLIDVFVLEAQEILDRSDALLLSLRGAPGDTKLLDGLRRDLHTIKGGANMLAIAPIGGLGHAMESLLESAAGRGQSLDGASIHAMEQGFDTLHTFVQAVAVRKPVAMPSALIERIEELSRGADVAETHSSAAEAISETPVAAPEHVSGTAAVADDALQVQETEPVFTGSEYIRVRASQIDAMVNGASEVAIYRSRLEQQMSGYRSNTAEMETTVARLREQLRRLEVEAEAQMTSRFQREGDASKFDPLELDRFSHLQELSRLLAESMSDMVAIQVGFDQLTRQSESLLTQQSRVSAELQESLMRSRMVPFDSIVPTLRRTLRQTAAMLGKEAQLRIEGAQGEMDRTVLERMKAPLEHMLRNALAHGIEDVSERLACGKPIEGSVRIALSREATETVLRISDDGHGFDRAAIRRRAIERGLLAPDARISNRELDAFILVSGFSTVENLSQVAGRGVGMDVVVEQIKQIGGSLSIESEPGRGTTFTVRLPFTLGVTQAIIVRLGDTDYAIPMNAVRGVVHVGSADLEALLTSEFPEYVYSGDVYSILDLAPMLGETAKGIPDGAQVPLLMVRSSDERAALRINSVLGSREIVVKSVGPQITSVPGILGATIMGDGSVVMILDLAPLLRRAATLRAQGVPQHPVVVPQQARERHLIMVVDDSITMRKATSRVLEREEMEVVTAKDGMDAIEKLADRVPDLVLLDIEMPRMDGYQLAENMRGNPRTARVPIIMITSRTGEKHRERAREIGVEGYFGKPYQEAELIQKIHKILEALKPDRKTT